MAAEDSFKMIIQRKTLNTSPSARLNSYNRHALAPWLQETGYLTPKYFYLRDRALEPFNMGSWLSPTIQKHLLRPASLVVELSPSEISSLLEIAADAEYNVDAATQDPRLHGLSQRMKSARPQLTIPDLSAVDIEAGFFIRMSPCSPKDVDGGNPQPVRSIIEALTKLVASKRTVASLLRLHNQANDCTTTESLNSKLFFFPYCDDLDPLSEWRCYVCKNTLVAISQSRFYQPNHPGITDNAIYSLVRQAQYLWTAVKPELSFDSCVLDVYAEVSQPRFGVHLIEVNPWGSHLGSGSLLFHWLNDSAILEPPRATDIAAVVVRLVEPGEAPVLLRNEAFMIGRGKKMDDELFCLRCRGLEWILEDEHHERFMALETPPGYSGLTTLAGKLEMFKRQHGTEDDRKDSKDRSEGKISRDHPLFLKLRRMYVGSKA